MEQNGLTEEDMSRIQSYLEKPPHLRRSEDLTPDQDDEVESRDSEVPLDLKHAVDSLDQEGGFESMAAFAEALPRTLPKQCPDCGGSLRASAMFADDDGTATVVRLVCLGHHRGLAASYVYEIATGELYLEREVASE